MDQLRILIADDDAEGADVIIRYIKMYFKDLSLLFIHEASMAKKAIQAINDNERPYDLIFTDLEFAAKEDKDPDGIQYSGKDVIVAAAKKFPSNQTIYFTVSGKKGSAKINDLEQELVEENIHFCPLLKDEQPNNVIKKIDSQLKKWSEYNFSIGIPQHEKNDFFKLLAEEKFDETLEVFGQKRELQLLLIYWHNKGETISIEKLLLEFPNAFYDLPNITFDKLFKNKGLSKIQYPLIKYYQQFYSYHIEDLPDMIKRAEHYLNELVAIYCLSPEKYEDSLNKCNAAFTTQFKGLHSKLRAERINVQGQLANPLDEAVMIQFKKRLWFRLFCIGAYFIGLSELDIYRLLATTFSMEEGIATEDNFKVFSRSLWLDNFSQKMTTWERNYEVLWRSLTDYERAFLRKWWIKIEELKDDELKDLYTVRDFSRVSKYITD